MPCKDFFGYGPQHAVPSQLEVLRQFPTNFREHFVSDLILQEALRCKPLIGERQHSLTVLPFRVRIPTPMHRCPFSGKHTNQGGYLALLNGERKGICVIQCDPALLALPDVLLGLQQVEVTQGLKTYLSLSACHLRSPCVLETRWCRKQRHHFHPRWNPLPIC